MTKSRRQCQQRKSVRRITFRQFGIRSCHFFHACQVASGSGFVQLQHRSVVDQHVANLFSSAVTSHKHGRLPSRVSGVYERRVCGAQRAYLLRIASSNRFKKLNYGIHSILSRKQERYFEINSAACQRRARSLRTASSISASSSSRFRVIWSVTLSSSSLVTGRSAAPPGGDCTP